MSAVSTSYTAPIPVLPPAVVQSSSTHSPFQVQVITSASPILDGFSSYQVCRTSSQTEMRKLILSSSSCFTRFNCELYDTFSSVYRQALDRSLNTNGKDFEYPSDKELYHKLQDLQRGYVFRGDTRSPQEIKEVGGLWPYSTLQTNREITPQFDPLNHHGGAMRESVFVSSTTSSTIAAKFATITGWVYALYANGCIDFGLGEQEMLMPGGFAWDDVVAFAQIRGGKFSDHIYIRNDFEQIDAAAFRQIYQAMSEI